MIELLTNAKKKKITELLNEEYGIEKLRHLFIQTGKGKIRIFSGSLSKEEINELAKNVHIDTIGARLCNIENDEIRLNFDILNIPELKSQINKNIIKITNEQVQKWLKGDNIEMVTDLGGKYIIVQNKGDFIGVARNNKTFIQNYVPKERRVK